MKQHKPLGRDVFGTTIVFEAAEAVVHMWSLCLKPLLLLYIKEKYIAWQIWRMWERRNTFFRMFLLTLAKYDTHILWIQCAFEDPKFKRYRDWFECVPSQARIRNNEKRATALGNLSVSQGGRVVRLDSICHNMAAVDRAQVLGTYFMHDIWQGWQYQWVRSGRESPKFTAPSCHIIKMQGTFRDES